METDPSTVGLLVLAVLMLAGAVLALRWFRRRSSRSAAMPPDLLVVGLGNPGPDYAGTRHNAGFDVVERLAERLGAGPFFERAREVDEALTVEAVYEGKRLLLAQPLTFMNRSGRSVAKLMDRFGLEAPSLLVVYDDLALPLGAVRLRPKGSAGGHNGVQDLITRLGTDRFDRVRVGIGSRFGHGQQVDYVLGPYDDEEQETAAEALGYAAEAVLGIVAFGLPEAMGRYNRRKSPVPADDGSGGGEEVSGG